MRTFFNNQMSGAIILLLAAIFVLAAISKFRSSDAFGEVLRNLFPPPLIKPVAIMVPLSELLLAGFLLSGVAQKKAIATAIALLIVFTIILSVMWHRGLKGCACFGETVNADTSGSGIIRNLVLIACAIFVLNQPGPILFWGPDFSTFLGRLTVIAGILCLWPCLIALVNRRKLIFNYSPP
jgi:uncharacterized membrane protein YphA (DoxX/SURF4 family)